MTMTAATQNADTALHLARNGFAVFPCQSGGAKAKSPMPFIAWRNVSTCDERQVRQWWQKWPDAAIGLDLAKSRLIVIDADRHGEADGVEAFGELMAAHGFDPDSAPLVATPNQGNHHFFRQPEGMDLGNGRGTLPEGIDVRGAGGYVVAPGTVMADGRAYEAFGDIAEAPDLPEWLAEILTAKRGGAETERIQPQTYSQHGLGGGDQPSHNQPTGDAEIEELLSYIPAACSYHDWVAVLMAIHAATDGQGLSIADRWSATAGAKYCGTKELEKKWRSFKRTGVTGATLAQLARDHGADLSEIALRHKVPEVDAVEAAEAARRLIENHDGSLADAETGELVEEPTHSKKELVAQIPYPPGLVGDIAKWIVATARRPQPELAIGAALTIVGTAAGRQFAGPTRSGTHLYVLGLAPTGTGKDHPLQAVPRIMAAAKLQAHLGPSEFISMPAVIKFLMRRPLSVCPMDEFGGFMKRINSRRASGFEMSISKIIRTMWSSSFAPYATPEWAGRDSETIFSPAMSLYGASTPEQFYSAMEGSSLEDGTLNRFLLLNGSERPAEREPEGDPSIVPDWIVNALSSIYYRSGEMASATRNDAVADPAAAGRLRHVTWCPDGSREAYAAFSADVEEIMRRDPDRGAFYARTAEMALRIATIVAVGRIDDDQVQRQDLDFGIAVARKSADMMADGAASHMADNEHQAQAQRIIRILKSRGGRASYRDLVRALQNSMRARDLKEVLAIMCDGGHLEKQEVKPASGPSTFWYQMH